MTMLPETELQTNRQRLHRLLGWAWQQLEHNPLDASVPAREAELLARRMADNLSWAHSLFVWGISSLHAAEAHEAITLLAKALAVYRFLGDERGQWSCQRAIARAWEFLGDHTQAKEIYGQLERYPNRAVFQAEAKWLRWLE